MFGVGLWELVIIALVALIAVGPEKLPKVMGYFAKIFREITRFKQEIGFQASLFEAELEKEKKALVIRPEENTVSFQEVSSAKLEVEKPAAIGQRHE